MKLHLLFLMVLCSMASIGQKTSTETAKLDLTLAPTVPIENVSSIGFKVHTSDLPFDKDSLRLYLGNLDLMMSDAEQASKIKSKTLKELTVVGGDGDLTVDMAFGLSFVVNEELKKTSCIKAKEGCSQYYYDVTYSLPTLVQVSNASGVLDVWELKPLMNFKFGNEQVETHQKTEKGSKTSISIMQYTSEAALKEAFNQRGEAWIARKAIVTQLGEMADILNDHLFFNDEKMKFDISYGKGKATDYTETETAAKSAVEKLESGKYSGLESEIQIWETWLAKFDAKNKKAAVNVKVAKGLNQNLAIAHTFLGNFNKAEEHAKKTLELETSGSMTNQNNIKALEELMAFIDRQEKATKYNAAIDLAKAESTAPDIKRLLAKRKFNEEIDFIIADDVYNELLKNKESLN